MSERFDIDVSYRDPWEIREEWPEDRPDPSEYAERVVCPIHNEAMVEPVEGDGWLCLACNPDYRP